MNRSTLIKLVHAGARNLFPDEDARRDWQEDRTGHRSCSKMSDADLQNLVDELRRKKALKPSLATPKASKGRQGLISKIGALLADKAKRQGSTVPWSYADAIAKKVCGVDKVQWCNQEQLRKVVAALSKDQKRMKKKGRG